MVARHYRPYGVGDERVPWMPYNFHAGNYYNEETGYSPQDETTAELLKAKCLPVPVWVFSPSFTLEALHKWTGRQIDMFAASGQVLHALRIKNPGQGKDWTVENVWEHVKTIKGVFKDRGMEPPIVYIHNHDFNGLGGHIGQGLLHTAQEDGFPNLVVDGGYRKCGTHNDLTIITDALKLTSEQKEALLDHGHIQQQIEQLATRFDSRNSQMTPWNSDWAGGTEGSDLRICKEFDINPRLINIAKEVASEVFPIERAVTPFSEYKLRLGIGIMIEPGIEPKNATEVRKWLQNGGKLKVGGDVLLGLKRWETLVAKPPEVDQLLANMPGELESAMKQGSNKVFPEDLPADFTSAQIYTALGYQQKGFEFYKAVKAGTDLSPLLIAPTVVHSAPLSLEAGTKFEVLDKPGDLWSREQVEFTGFGKAPNGDITMGFKTKGAVVTTKLPDPNTDEVCEEGNRKATPGNKYELPCIVPGEVLAYSVQPGDVLEAGAPMCVLESMKMEMKISVPDEAAGFKVKALPCAGRTKEFQGDVLALGDLLLELEDA
jgi:biotin carboxyl carrier protein